MLDSYQGVTFNFARVARASQGRRPSQKNKAALFAARRRLVT